MNIKCKMGWHKKIERKYYQLVNSNMGPANMIYRRMECVHCSWTGLYNLPNAHVLGCKCDMCTLAWATPLGRDMLQKEFHVECKLVDALLEAKSLIGAFMSGPNAWSAFQSSPEMIKINGALENAKLRRDYGLAESDFDLSYNPSEAFTAAEWEAREAKDNPLKQWSLYKDE